MKRTSIYAAIIAACAFGAYFSGVAAQAGGPQGRSKSLMPANATSCDLLIPIKIALTPLNKPGVGDMARFSVSIESGIDPDLVRKMWIEYDLPERMRPTRDYLQSREIPRAAREGRDELALLVPDAGRYVIRARVMVELVDGKTISQTATRWVNLGSVMPEGMIGRIVDPDGTGVRVYQGITARKN